jgi:atypical dual specificity phosphatase
MSISTLNFSWVIQGKLAGHRAISADSDIAFLREQGVKALVRMAEGVAAEKLHEKIIVQGMIDLHVPVPDFTAPTKSQIVSMVDFISESITRGQPVAVSCGAGYGRTGTILACYLVMQGSSAKKAVEEVRRKRPDSIEKPEQEKAIYDYAKSLHK